MAVLCENCKKKTATIYFEKIVNGVKTEHNLCPDCAQGFDSNFSPISSIDGFLNDFVNIMLNSNYGEKTIKKIQRIEPCKSCGMTYDEFCNHNKIGCGDCYTAFHTQIKTIFGNIQKSDHHTGKIPKRAGAHLIYQKNIDDLKSELSNAIAAEEFEQAAILRDKIRDIGGGK